ALRRETKGRAARSCGLHGGDRLLVRMPEDERPPRLHPVAERAPIRGLDVRALRTGGEQGRLEPDRPHRTDGGVDAAGGHVERAAPQCRDTLELYSQPASSFAQYVTITSAPARRIAVSDSSAAARSSRSPAAAAAFSIAYSPLTL